MAGHRLDTHTRRALRRGLKVSVYRGWRRPEPERPASACRKIDLLSGKVVGILIRPAAGRLRLSCKTPWRFQREAKP